MGLSPDHVRFSLHVGGGPRMVVSTAAFHARVRGSFPGLGGLKETKMFLPSVLLEPPCPRGSVLGLRPPGSEFRILCLEGSVISLIPPSSVVSLVQFSLYVHKSGLKPDSFHFQHTCRFRVRPAS